MRGSRSDEVAASCLTPLDALESLYERTRELVTAVDLDLATVSARLDALATRSRSAAPFEATLAAAARERHLGGDDLEADPVAAHGRLQESHASLADLRGEIDAIESADDRRRQLVERITELRRQVADRRGVGWRLREPGADPDRLLADANHEASLAGDALDAANVTAAASHLGRGEADAKRQHYFRAVAVLEEAERQADCAATCLAVISTRHRAAEDAQLAAQAAADLADAEGLVRRAASWYAEGVKVDVRPAETALQSARDLLGQQRYEDAIHAAGEAGERTRLASATATAGAERRRARRIAKQRQRQLEESFGRLARGAGPWVISLPGAGLAGPNPWQSSGTAVRATGGGRSTGGHWSRDVAEARW